MFMCAVSSALARSWVGCVAISTGNLALKRAGTGWGLKTCRKTCGARSCPTAWGTMARAASPKPGMARGAESARSARWPA